ncbi:MAG: Cys-tRNA(Pro) deacylase [Pseudobutyrivibrio sp.]|nr:Cys-tRNA(Pro) deacylase [Pseudobutyrivibrio sp.]
MAKQQDKTNVMRLLEQKKIPYGRRDYEELESTNGEDIANYLGENPKQVFKTLVAIGKSKQYYVFVIPVNAELDLKKAASACHEKSVEMIKQKDLLPLTGYIHGGCSPIGMKKQFSTYVDESALEYEKILFSAGKVGHQVEVAPSGLEKIIRLEYAQLI